MFFHVINIAITKVTVKPVGPDGNDFKHIVLRSDGEVIPAYLNAGLVGIRDIISSYRPPLAFYDLDKRDYEKGDILP